MSLTLLHSKSFGIESSHSICNHPRAISSAALPCISSALIHRPALPFDGRVLCRQSCHVSIVRRKAGVAFATLAVLLLWGAAPTLYYAVEARPYALVFFSFSCLLLSWDIAIRSKPRGLALLGVGMATFCLAIAHVFRLFILINLLLIHRRGTFYDRYCLTTQVAIMVALAIFLGLRVRRNRRAAYAGSIVLVLPSPRRSRRTPALSASTGSFCCSGHEQNGSFKSFSKAVLRSHL